ncbi:MAG: YitT family protein [Lachnospiraceae bacterium]|nr:YitT family protein [Lachnospiraceae bacterium]
MKKIISQLVLIPFASLIYAIDVACFLDPNGIAPGGLTGVAILLNRLLVLDTGSLILLLNIPLLIIAWKVYGVSFVLTSLYSLSWISVFTNFLEEFSPATNDLLAASIGGGALIAIGLGLILRIGATTGGTDIVVKLLQRKNKHVKTGAMFLLVDLCVLILSFFVLRDVEKLIYAGITIGIVSYGLDLVLYGKDEAKLIFIISERPQLLAECFLYRLNIGVTLLEGRGGYTKEGKKIIMCVMKKRFASLVLEAVKELDPGAFMIVSDASEIYGNGYKSYNGGNMG